MRGGGESLQAMPDEALGKLFGRLHTLGEQLMRDGRFARIARRGRWHGAVLGDHRSGAERCFQVPVSQFYWNSQLKKNGAWDRRFAAPYAPPAR